MQCYTVHSLEKISVGRVRYKRASSGRSGRQSIVPRTELLVAVTLGHHNSPVLDRSTWYVAMTTYQSVCTVPYAVCRFGFSRIRDLWTLVRCGAGCWLFIICRGFKGQGVLSKCLPYTTVTLMMIVGEMSLLSAPAVGLLLLLMCAFIAIARRCTHLLAYGRRRRNFAIQETATRGETSALVFGCRPPLVPIRNVNEPPRVTEPRHRTLRDQRVNHYAGGHQAPYRGHSLRSERPRRVMQVEVYPVQESLGGHKGTSARV